MITLQYVRENRDFNYIMLAQSALFCVHKNQTRMNTKHEHPFELEPEINCNQSSLERWRFMLPLAWHMAQSCGIRWGQ